MQFNSEIAAAMAASQRRRGASNNNAVLSSENTSGLTERDHPTGPPKHPTKKWTRPTPPSNLNNGPPIMGMLPVGGMPKKKKPERNDIVPLTPEKKAKATDALSSMLASRAPRPPPPKPGSGGEPQASLSKNNNNNNNSAPKTKPGVTGISAEQKAKATDALSALFRNRGPPPGSRNEQFQSGSKSEVKSATSSLPQRKSDVVGISAEQKAQASNALSGLFGNRPPPASARGEPPTGSKPPVPLQRRQPKEVIAISAERKALASNALSDLFGNRPRPPPTSGGGGGEPPTNNRPKPSKPQGRSEEVTAISAQRKSEAAGALSNMLAARLGPPPPPPRGEHDLPKRKRVDLASQEPPPQPVRQNNNDRVVSVSPKAKSQTDSALPDLFVTRADANGLSRATTQSMVTMAASVESTDYDESSLFDGRVIAAQEALDEYHTQYNPVPQVEASQMPTRQRPHGQPGASREQQQKIMSFMMSEPKKQLPQPHSPGEDDDMPLDSAYQPPPNLTHQQPTYTVKKEPSVLCLKKKKSSSSASSQRVVRSYSQQKDGGPVFVSEDYEENRSTGNNNKSPSLRIKDMFSMKASPSRKRDHHPPIPEAEDGNVEVVPPPTIQKQKQPSPLRRLMRQSFGSGPNDRGSKQEGRQTNPSPQRKRFSSARLLSSASDDCGIEQERGSTSPRRRGFVGRVSGSDDGAEAVYCQERRQTNPSPQRKRFSSARLLSSASDGCGIEQERGSTSPRRRGFVERVSGSDDGAEAVYGQPNANKKTQQPQLQQAQVMAIVEQITGPNNTDGIPGSEHLAVDNSAALLAAMEAYNRNSRSNRKFDDAMDAKQRSISPSKFFRSLSPSKSLFGGRSVSPQKSARSPSPQKSGGYFRSNSSQKSRSPRRSARGRGGEVLVVTAEFEGEVTTNHLERDSSSASRSTTSKSVRFNDEVAPRQKSRSQLSPVKRRSTRQPVAVDPEVLALQRELELARSSYSEEEKRLREQKAALRESQGRVKELEQAVRKTKKKSNKNDASVSVSNLAFQTDQEFVDGVEPTGSSGQRKRDLAIPNNLPNHQSSRRAVTNKSRENPTPPIMHDGMYQDVSSRRSQEASQRSDMPKNRKAAPVVNGYYEEEGHQQAQRNENLSVSGESLVVGQLLSM